MTEISEKSTQLAPAVERFILHWGEMGERWGVNRSVSQIHALLYVTGKPLSADDIAAALSIARSNVSTSLRELLNWGLVRRTSVLGERRDFFEAEADMLEMIRRIAIGRKARELDPALEVLRQCVSDSSRDKSISPTAKARFKQMLDIMERVDSSFDEIIKLPSPLLSRLIRMGGAIARLVAPQPRKKET